MSYFFKYCIICNERRLEMKMATEKVCRRYSADKNIIKLFSVDNHMIPKKKFLFDIDI
jgi:hypothetical protein